VYWFHRLSNRLAFYSTSASPYPTQTAAARGYLVSELAAINKAVRRTKFTKYWDRCWYYQAWCRVVTLWGSLLTVTTFSQTSQTTNFRFGYVVLIVRTGLLNISNVSQIANL